MIMTLTFLSLIVGAGLGQRHTFFILIPAIACTLSVAVGSGVATGLDLWSTVLMMALTVMSLQIGYVAGALVRSHEESVLPTVSIAKRQLRPIQAKDHATV